MEQQQQAQQELCERLLEAWVGLTGILKNSRLTHELSYNEAIVMLMVYRRYCEDGKGVLSLKEIIAGTKMLKSLVNRTVNSLEKAGYLIKERSSADSRAVNVRFVPERAEGFLRVHEASLALAGRMVDVIGEEDAERFIGIYRKIALSEQQSEKEGKDRKEQPF